MSVFKAGKYEFPIGERTYVMGILNVTPDSFSDGGRWNTKEKALKHALEMVKDGADIIDIGAQSTRPGYTLISKEEEMERLMPALEFIVQRVEVAVSVDTFYSEVAREALKQGVAIINDVTGFSDVKMFDLMRDFDCGAVIMYDGANSDMKRFFKDTLEKLDVGQIDRSRVCFDVGIGFGKSYEENLLAIKNLQDFKIEKIAMLVGASRKRVVGLSCGNPPFDERLAGTIAAHTLSVANGADIIRVHDVKEAVQAARVADAILRS